MGVASGSWSTRASDSGFVAMVNNDLSLICGYTLVLSMPIVEYFEFELPERPVLEPIYGYFK